MTLAGKMATLFRGDVPISDLPREFLRRRRAAARMAIERRSLETITRASARLQKGYSDLSPAELLQHFRERPYRFFALDGIDTQGRESLERSFPGEADRLISAAEQITLNSTWDLAGLGPLKFDAENAWRADPLTGQDWGLAYHADVVLYTVGGPDIRVLWELNRMGHTVTLAQAYHLTGDERFADTFFEHVESWVEQNPYGRGSNWGCAMEVALRAINILAAFDIFRLSQACTEHRLLALLQLFDQHGRFIVDNSEFSYVGTSNHYFSDVVGLFWTGTMLPELNHAAEWGEFGRQEIEKEVKKQVLPDGADFEASTGYHKFVTEMLLYSQLLAERNDIEMAPEYSDTVHRMLLYVRGIIRPDGRVPLIGDADGSQIVPLVKRDADDQSYLLDIGTTMYKDPLLQGDAALAPEIYWLFGAESLANFKSVAKSAESPRSVAFVDAGAYVMRGDELYLHFNANDIGARGRGSHGHNDALSIEVFAHGRPFIVDPGSYVYNLDRAARHTFRSTAYHSTVMVDATEQNTTDPDLPFIMGNEARPAVLSWETREHRDCITAEHFGYQRLQEPVIHCRTVEFDKIDKFWSIWDRLTGRGEHSFSFTFHLAPGVSMGRVDDTVISLNEEAGNAILLGWSGIASAPQVIAAFTSVNYGHREASSLLKWEVSSGVPFHARFILVPVAAGEKPDGKLELLHRLTDNIDT